MKDGYTVFDSLELESKPESVTQVELMVDKVCADLGVNEDFYGNVLIAVTEAVNNAINHGNKCDSQKMVKVVVGNTDADIVFEVADEGPGFDFENLPDPTAPENIEMEHGRGIFLMKNLADSVEFDNGGKSVTIYLNKA